MLNCKNLAAVMRKAASHGLIWYDNGSAIAVMDEIGTFCVYSDKQALRDSKNSVPALMAELIGRIQMRECIRIWKANGTYTEQRMMPDVAEESLAMWQAMSDNVQECARIALSVGNALLYQTADGGEILTVSKQDGCVSTVPQAIADLTNFKLQWSGEGYVYITSCDRPAQRAIGPDLWRALEKVTWTKQDGDELRGREMGV